MNTNGHPNMVLVKYDAACRAIAEAKRVDEAKDIIDIAIAIKAYARQAENRDLEADAVEIRLRAERKVGQLMAMQVKMVGFNEGGRPKTGLSENPVSKPPTLAEAGINKNLAHRSRQLAKESDKKFEATLTQARDAVYRAVHSVISQDKAARDEEMKRLREANPALADLTAKKLRELKRNGKAVELLQVNVENAMNYVSHLPKTVRRVIETEAWRRHNHGRHVYEHASFADFITAPVPAGCGWKLADVQALIKDKETLAIWCKAIGAGRRHIGGVTDQAEVLIAERNGEAVGQVSGPTKGE
jgi:hypothetical protein